jgi:CMP-N,N'-diacetyllegionaminic acid synthase
VSELLFLIPARGGSKGLPGKNIKKLNGKPLIHYSIELARQFTSDENICVSTDDPEIKKTVEAINLMVPFLRPSDLANDEASTHVVVMHALNFYISINKNYKGIVLLQPTSPLRLKKHLAEAIQQFNQDTDMVVGVKETKSNPFTVLVQVDENGYLKKLNQESNITRRQDAPKVFEINGAIYIYNITALQSNLLNSSQTKKIYTMPIENSVDIDTQLDWQWAEFLLNNQIVKLDY